MTGRAAILRNLGFWHWYPEVLLDGLTGEQRRWQPEGQDTSVNFAIWHSYRAADEICHGMVMQRPSVYTTENWAERLPVMEMGATPFGNGFSREQIGRLDFDPAQLTAYASAVGRSLADWVSEASDEEASAEVAFPFFAKVYPGYDHMSKLEAVTFFAIAHTAEHLGEVQLIRGLQGLRGAPL